MKKDTKLYLERTFRAARRDLSFESLVSAVNPFLERVDTPVSLGVFLRLKYKSYDEYLNMEIDPMNYDNSDKFFLDYQCIKLFSKQEIYPHVYNTRKEAVDNFIRSEKECFETNRRFEYRMGPDFRDPAVSAISHGAMRKISRILGACPSIAELPLRFGPGNNVGLSNNTSVIDKLTSELTVTPNLYNYTGQVMETCPAWLHLRSKTSEVPSTVASHIVQTRIVSGSKLGFVPKTAKTDRSICTEPLLNSIVQLGIGTVIRKRLRRAGCNLDSQHRNQELARIGSITNQLATVDLKAASDTISSMVVLELLPEPWFDLLNTARSTHYSVGENCYEFNKFSSMGNGFTFELESLIFLALARATCEFMELSCENVSVYGDDIIIPKEAVTLFYRMLKFYGFEVNQSKSFTEGPFRESCGKDWFLGRIVRPLFLKRRPTNQSLMSWCNHISRLPYFREDVRLHVLYRSLKELVPKVFHILKGPDGFGDGHFVEPYEKSFGIPHAAQRRGWEGRGFWTLSTKPLSFRSTGQAAYVGALYSAQHHSVRPFTDKQHISHASVRGELVYTRRRRTRTVLLRQFQQWNSG